MATDTKYDYSTDPEFLAAPDEQKHAYLMKADPDYAKAKPEDQKAYLEQFHPHAQPIQSTAALRSTEERPLLQRLTTQPTAEERNAGIYGIPRTSKIDELMNLTEAYKKDHPVIAAIGEGLKGLKQVFEPALTAASVLSLGAGMGEVGSPREAFGPSLPKMSLEGDRLVPVADQSRSPFMAGKPRTVYEQPLEVKATPVMEQTVRELPKMDIPRPRTVAPRLQPAYEPRAEGPEWQQPVDQRLQPIEEPAAPARRQELAPIEATERPAATVEPLQAKPLAERRLGQAGRAPTIESVVNQAMNVKPLDPDVPLREQFPQTIAEKPVETDPIKAKYPDPEIRQLVRANGEKIYEAAKGDPELLKSIHDLTRVDLRQALINAGEDMGQTTVSNSKFAGKGSITREAAFDRLLELGKKPAEIVDLAKKAAEEFSDDPKEFVSEDYVDPENEGGLYHVTTAKDKVLAEGLKSRKETGNTGLGGGVSPYSGMQDKGNTISVTFDEGHANQIAERMKLAIKAAKDEVSPKEVLDRMISDTQIPDDTPDLVAEALRAPDDVREDWEAFEQWFEKEYPKGSAYDLLQELDDALPQLNPEAEHPVRVGFTANKGQMAKLDPDQVEILNVEARKGAKAQHIGDEAELRFDPKDLRVKK